MVNVLILETVLANLAADTGLAAVIRRDISVSDEDRRSRRKDASVWVVATKTTEALGNLADDPRWPRLLPDPNQRTWTDDYSNILEAVK